MVGDKRQGYAILAAMARPLGLIVAGVCVLEVNAPRHRPPGWPAPAMEGKETRFGEAASALFAASTTGTSTGAVNSFHASFTALGGGLTIFNMGLGEVAPGGVGSGLYGMLVLAMITVFVAGLMVGRTPEYLGKKITAREIKLVSLYILTMPVIVLGRHRLGDRPARRRGHRSSTPARTACPRCCTPSCRRPTTTAPPLPGLSAEHAVLQHGARPGHAGSVASCRSSSSSPWPGRWPASSRYPPTAGTLPTHRSAVRRACSSASSLIVAGLTFFPVLALGPLAEGL